MAKTRDGSSTGKPWLKPTQNPHNTAVSGGSLIRAHICSSRPRTLTLLGDVTINIRRVRLCFSLPIPYTALKFVTTLHSRGKLLWWTFVSTMTTITHSSLYIASYLSSRSPPSLQRWPYLTLTNHHGNLVIPERKKKKNLTL